MASHSEQASTTSEISTLSSSWESVSHMTPLEEQVAQIDHELRTLISQTPEKRVQNNRGIDIDSLTHRAIGRVSLQINKAIGLNDVVKQHPLLGASGATPQLYVSCVMAPWSACEKHSTKHACTAAVATDEDNSEVWTWGENIVLDGVKNNVFIVKLAIRSSADVIADVVLGEAEIHSNILLDQETHYFEVDLTAPEDPTAASGKESSPLTGKLFLHATFEYNELKKHEEMIEAVKKRKAEAEFLVEQYKITSEQLNVPVSHPAAFGDEAAKSSLYIPSNQFHIDQHHPASVAASPLPDKARVVTPYGRGIIINFRTSTRTYVIKIDPHEGSTSSMIAYLRQDIVVEENNEPLFRVYMKVVTPYGVGTVDEIRNIDNVIVVQTSFGKIYLQKYDVKLPDKSLEKLQNIDFLEKAMTLADEGNDYFRKGEVEEAVTSYLQALQSLQRVDNDTATHKQKAMSLQTMIRCHLNIGACKLRADSNQDAIIACTNALNILNVLSDNRDGKVVMWMGRLGLSEQQMFEEWPVKARYRRAKACVNLGQYADAKADLLEGIKLSPKDKASRSLLEQITATLKKQKKNEQKIWGGILTATQEPEVVPIGIDDEVFQEVQKYDKVSGPESQLSKRNPIDSSESWYKTPFAFTAASLVAAVVAAGAVYVMKKRTF